MDGGGCGVIKKVWITRRQLQCQCPHVCVFVSMAPQNVVQQERTSKASLAYLAGSHVPAKLVGILEDEQLADPELVRGESGERGTYEVGEAGGVVVV